MKLCPNCNKRNEDKAKFCFNCGLNFGKYYNKSTGRKEYCENCGAKLVANASFCIECGTKVEKVQNLPIVDTEVKKEKSTFCIDDKKGKTPEETYEELGFIVENGVLVKYIGRDKNVTVPNGINKIGESVFYGCIDLTSIEIPNSVTTIGNNAFRICTNLTSIEIPSGVTTIGDYAFYTCTKLTSVEIPNSVTTIGGSAFRNCTNLTSIEIPNSVTTIGEYAFAYCLNLKSIKLSKKCQCETGWALGCPASVTYVD